MRPERHAVRWQQEGAQLESEVPSRTSRGCFLRGWEGLAGGLGGSEHRPPNTEVVGSIPEATNECTNKWNNTSVFLSPSPLPSSLSKMFI